MPTYEYECMKGHRFEKFQSMKDAPIRSCPECKSKAKRLISAGAGVLFKGSGFYQTDYRSGDYKKKSEAEKQRGKDVKKESCETPSTCKTKCKQEGEK